jgi:hypothetical protein
MKKYWGFFLNAQKYVRDHVYFQIQCDLLNLKAIELNGLLSRYFFKEQHIIIKIYHIHTLRLSGQFW